MDAVVLVGGLGTRLRTVVADRPKALADIGGMPFLEWLLRFLEHSGEVGRILLAVGYRKEQIAAYIAQRPSALEIVCVEEETPLGTGGALKQASRQVHTPTFWALNGDAFFNFSLRAMAQRHSQHLADMTYACHFVADAGRYGLLTLDAQDRVCAFQEKQQTQGGGWINGGVYLLQKDVLDEAPEGPFSLERDFFPHILHKRVFAYKAEGAFLDIGTPETYAQASRVDISAPEGHLYQL